MGYTGVAAQTAGNVFSQYYQGKAAKQSAEYESDIAEQNALLADQEARQANMATRQRLSKHYREKDQVQASNRVAFAASGVQLASGSPLHSAISTAQQAELDADVIRTEGDIEAYNATLRASQFRQQGEIAEFKGKNAQTESYFGMGGSILKGGADMYDLWSTRKKKGRASGVKSSATNRDIAPYGWASSIG